MDQVWRTMHTTLGGLDTQVHQRLSGAPRAAVVLAHGFGAPGDDLVPLWEELVGLEPSLGAVRFHFPAAPLKLDAWGGSRAWWHIDLPGLQRAQASPEAMRAFRRQEPEGMAPARAAVLRLVQEAAVGAGVAVGKVVLGGFSQGAMIATDVALRLEERPAGLAILSGTLLLEDVWEKKARARTGLPIFQAHGRQDPVLPWTGAVALQELLTSAGSPPEFFPFDGGHTLTGPELQHLARFLAARLD
jgi:phospholipase/carboxylesterase